MLFSTIQVKALPCGTPAFEANKAAVLAAFAAKVPPSLWLPPALIADPPLDVTAIPASCGFLTPTELHITEDYDAVGLAAAIRARELTAVAVATAFAKRAIVAHQLTSCLTQWFMDEAVARAAALDAYQAAHEGATVGPLHGVPVSIKDHIPVAGTVSSAGCLSTALPDEADCGMTAILRRLGAVFYCKTNQPQTLMHLESDSLWGRVLNPYNLQLSAGGSSGGEAALLALRGSVLGVGTDIGGSVRAPAAFCGLYGFKATAETLPTRNFVRHSSAATLNVLASTGPMAHSLRDLDLFMRVVLAPGPELALDPELVPIPWRGLHQALPSAPLRVGIVAHDGFIQPQPPVARALAWARTQLQHDARIEVKPFVPYGATAAWPLVRKLYWPDGGRACREELAVAGEPVHPLSAWIWRDEEAGGVISTDDLNALRIARDDFRYAFARSWHEQGVDVVLGPGFVGPAPAHDTALYWTYTSLYNLVNYPGVTLPTPVRTAAGEQYAADYVPLSAACQQVHDLWGAGDFAGAPVALQLVAAKYRDNELFRALQVLKDALQLP